MKNLLKNFTIFFIIFLVIAGLFYNVAGINQAKEQVGLQKLVAEINSEAVESIAVTGNILQIKLKNGQEQSVQKESGESLSTLLKNFSVAPEKLAKINIEVKDESGLYFWLSTL